MIIIASYDRLPRYVLEDSCIQAFLKSQLFDTLSDWVGLGWLVVAMARIQTWSHFSHRFVRSVAQPRHAYVIGFR